MRFKAVLFSSSILISSALCLENAIYTIPLMKGEATMEKHWKTILTVVTLGVFMLATWGFYKLFGKGDR